MPLTQLNFQPGIDIENTATGAEGKWIDCDKVRFRKGLPQKIGSFKSKADKMVFDMKDQFIVVDTEELHQYLKDNNTKVVNLEQLISSLEWNIILPK